MTALVLKITLIGLVCFSVFTRADVQTMPSLKGKVVANHCYLNSFHQKDFPWKIADCLNFEEVFKNYQYYEATYNEKTKILVIKKIVQGKLISTDSYSIE
ncbi:MAG: hypothetical protein H6625_08565 [Bdellovibrionaceae bacterium]|nr:hypothetical protein [Pseudobdellovibrionaceae bacterium]